MKPDLNATRITYHSRFVREEFPLWMGTEILKYPSDLITYQQILHKTRPDLLIETGTHRGGSALFFANMFDLIGKGAVISIDITNTPPYPDLPRHERITYISGSSTDPKILEQVKGMTSHMAYPGTMQVSRNPKTMVILDSNHRTAHVADELVLYDPLVSPGCYMVVEDTIIAGHPVQPHSRSGPYEAVEAFLAQRGDDYRKESWGYRSVVSQHLDGWLLKLK